MISATLMPGGAGYEALFQTEYGVKIALEKVSGKAEAERRMYFHNRNYIVQTLTNWLKQRRYALKFFSKEDTAVATSLIDRLDEHKYTPYPVVIRFIRNNISDFLKCVPADGTQHHKHYAKTIMPMLDFCIGKIE